METIDIYKIYLFMIRFYGVTKFEVFSRLNENSSKPLESMIEFYMDKTRKVNLLRLNRILERDIKNVKRFFVIVEDMKIIIHIAHSEKKGLFDYDFEFSNN